jgi:hypothetical protein
MKGDYRLLRPVRGIVNPAYQKALATGYKTGTPGFNRTFVEELGKIPAIMNLAEKQSETVAGLWSTIAGFADILWSDLSGASEDPGILTFWVQLKDILRSVRDTGWEIMDYLHPFLVELGASIGFAFKYIWDMLQNIWKVLGPVLIPAGKIFVQIARILMTLFINFGKIIIKIGGLIADVFMTIGKHIGSMKFIEKLVYEITEFVTGLQMTFQMFSEVLDDIFGGIIKKLDAFMNWLDKKGWSLGRLITALSTLGASEVYQKAAEEYYKRGNVKAKGDPITPEERKILEYRKKHPEEFKKWKEKTPSIENLNIDNSNHIHNNVFSEEEKVNMGGNQRKKEGSIKLRRFDLEPVIKMGGSTN